MFGHARPERGQHDGAGDLGVGADVQGVARVVIEPGDDLRVGAVGQADVGEVGLPALVRLLGLEADVRALRLLLRGRDHPAVPGQDPRDRRPGHRGAVPVQVPADRLGPASCPEATSRSRSDSTAATSW